MHSSCSTRTTTFTRGLLLLMCISPALASCPEGTFERLTDENGNDVTNCAWCDEGRSCGTACGLCFNCPPGSTAASGSQSLTDCVCKSGYTGPDGGPCELDSSCYCLGTTFPSDFLNQEGFSTEYGTSCQAWEDGDCAAHGCGDKALCHEIWPDQTEYGYWCCQAWCYVDETCALDDKSSSNLNTVCANDEVCNSEFGMSGTSLYYSYQACQPPVNTQVKYDYSTCPWSSGSYSPTPPCEPGTYYDSSSSACKPCPPGTSSSDGPGDDSHPGCKCDGLGRVLTPDEINDDLTCPAACVGSVCFRVAIY